MTILAKLFSFHGRIRRRDWWLLHLGLGVAETIVLLFLARLSHQGFFEYLTELKTTGVGFLLAVSFLWPVLALDAKRLHDRNRSAKLLIPLYVFFWLPRLLAFASGMGLVIAGHPTIQTALLWTSLVVKIGYYFELGFRDSAPGADQFGPSPKRATEADAAEVFG